MPVHVALPGSPSGKFARDDGTWQSVSGGSTPTGTGWRHVTSGVEDGAASTPTYDDTGAAAASHNHAATDINSGTLDGDRLPAFSTTKRAGVPATGTPSGLFLKDDGTWAAAGGSGLTQPQVLARSMGA